MLYLRWTCLLGVNWQCVRVAFSVCVVHRYLCDASLHVFVCVSMCVSVNAHDESCMCIHMFLYINRAFAYIRACFLLIHGRC